LRNPLGAAQPDDRFTASVFQDRESYLGASGANSRTSALEHSRPDGQALFPAGSNFPERAKVFLQEPLSAFIGPFDRMFIIRLCRARLVTHKPMCLIVAIEPGLCGRINLHAHRSLVMGMDWHALQTQFPPSRIELWNAPQFQLPSLHRVLIKAGARNPIATIATTINGHSNTNQKEIFHSESLGVGFSSCTFLKRLKTDILGNLKLSPNARSLLG
jgi:hypothetical protein